MRVNAKSEAARLELIDRIHDLRADPDASLDALTSMASLTCNQPMALVSLVEEARQVFISRHGLELTETPREVSFCAKAIVACTNEEIFEVGDTHLDPRFRNNDLVVNDPRLRFYAGVPLEPAEGLPVGTLCVLGTKPAELTPIQRHELIRLAHIAEQLIRLQLLSDAERELRNRLEESEHRLRAAYDKRSHAGRTIAHDLATPLAAIRMTAESLRLQQPPQPLLR